jgi:PhnB protein
MRINPYLNFNGQCEEAFKFYERTFAGKIEFAMTHGNSPMAEQVAPEWRDKIMHICLAFGDQLLLGSDAPPEHYQPQQGFFLQVAVKSPSEAEHLFQTLSENGKVCMSMQETFWSPRFGMLVDKFGTPWMINCEGAALPAQGSRQ